MQLSQLSSPEGTWNKKVLVIKRQLWKLCSILKSPCEVHLCVWRPWKYSADLVVLLKNRENTCITIFSKGSQREFWMQSWEHWVFARISFFSLHPTNLTYRDSGNLKVKSVLLKTEKTSLWISDQKPLRSPPETSEKTLFWLNKLKKETW